MLSLILFFFATSIAMAGKPSEIQYISPVHNSTLNSRTSNIIIRPGGNLAPRSTPSRDGGVQHDPRARARGPPRCPSLEERARRAHPEA